MRLYITDSLFPWDKLPDSPDLTSLRFLLDMLPDERLLAALRAHRGKGRNDYEKSRGTLKYRCPARHEGWSCPSDGLCNRDSRYGKTVRVRCELDLRRFPPIPRATKEFERRYKGRTAIERVNARAKLFWGADDGNVTGAERFHAHLATIMLVHISIAHWLAMSPRYEGKSLSPTRLSQIARRLQKAAVT